MEDNRDIVGHNNGAYTPSIPEKADIAVRIAAFIIDHSMLTFILAIPAVILFFGKPPGDTGGLFDGFLLWLLAAFLGYCLKDIVKGQSLGKYMLGLAVRNSSDTSETPEVYKLIARNVLSFLWPVELIALIISSDHTKLGDRIAGTNVYRISSKPKIGLLTCSVILILVVLISSFIVGIVGILKSDGSYQTSIAYIEENPGILDAAGSIEGYGFMPFGSLSYAGEYGEASYTIQVIGSKDTVNVYIELEKKPDQDWEIIYFDYSE